MKIPIALATVLTLLISAGTAWGKIVTKTVEYKQGNTVLEGYLAYDDAIKANARVSSWSTNGTA